MTDKLPPNLLKLFLPRPALEHKTPLDREPNERRRPVISGLAAVLDRCKDHDKDYVPKETVAEIKARKVSSCRFDIACGVQSLTATILC